MEKTFKFIFFIAILVFCMVVIAFFLLGIKIALIWLSDITIMGIQMTRPV